MVVSTVASFISILGTVLYVLIIVRALLSWIAPAAGGDIMRVLVDVTEPILMPIRRILPPLGGLDLSPLVAMILIYVIQDILLSLLYSVA